MKPVQLGVLGTGTVVREFHLPALACNPRAQIAAIGNLREASAQRLADDFRIDRVFTDFSRMADDPDIDAVVIALPNYLHAPVAVQMLQAGKHVLCEKPMAMTAAEARQMVDAADTASRKLMIAHVWRFSPQVRWLRQVLESGALGSVSRAKGHAIVAGRGPDPESWFVRPETAGGGALADVGIHSIDTISFLFSDSIRPVRITARIDNRFQRLAVEDTASVRIEYDNGLVAEIDAGWYHPEASGPHGAVELFGSVGEARTLPPQFSAASVRSNGNLQTVAAPPCDRHPDDDRTVYADQIDHFLDCVREDRAPLCDGRQGLRNMIVLESAYRSARAGRSIVLEPPPSLATLS
jgi:predicted dehydrogenase